MFFLDLIQYLFPNHRIHLFPLPKFSIYEKICTNRDIGMVFALKVEGF